MITCHFGGYDLFFSLSSLNYWTWLAWVLGLMTPNSLNAASHDEIFSDHVLHLAIDGRSDFFLHCDAKTHDMWHQVVTSSQHVGMVVQHAWIRPCLFSRSPLSRRRGQLLLSGEDKLSSAFVVPCILRLLSCRESNCRVVVYQVFFAERVVELWKVTTAHTFWG